MDLDWQRIRPMAKWICIFCFEMKGAAMFDRTVLRCNHFICIKCFKKRADFLNTMRSSTAGQRFPRARMSTSSQIRTVAKWQLKRCRKLFSLPF